MQMTPGRSIALTFAVFGLGFGLWAGASAALIARSGVDVTVFGAGLTAFTAAYLIAMGAASTLARMSSVRALVTGALLGCIPAEALLLTAADPGQLVAGLVFYGFAAGALDSAMNSEAAALEAQVRRPIMARFHGAASAAVAIGAILGSLLVRDITIWIASSIASLSYCLGAFVAWSRPGVEGRPLADGGPLNSRVITQSLVVIGIVLGVSIASETGTMAWSSSLLTSESPRFAALAGLGGAFFAGCQAILRLNADAVRARIDDRNLMALSLLLAAAGLALVAAPLGFVGGVIGFAIVGVGTGAVVPCSFALAGTRPGVSAAASISAVAFFGIFARLPAPLAIGFVASIMSLSAAFLALAAILVVAAGVVILLVPSPKIVLGRAML